MNNKFISYLVLTFCSLSSWLHSQSVNLDNFASIQALNVQKCAVVQVNASWNHANRVKVEKLAKLCYVGEIDLNNKTVEKKLTSLVNDMYVDESKDFLNSIIKDKKPKIDGWDGFQTLKIALACIKSSKENRVIKIQ